MQIIFESRATRVLTRSLQRGQKPSRGTHSMCC
jgi:hypothetical protein